MAWGVKGFGSTTWGFGDVSTSVTTPAVATMSLGNETVNAAANVSAATNIGTSAIGTVSVSGAANTTVTGSAATSAIGSLTTISNNNLSVTGLVGTTAISPVITIADANIYPTGTSAISACGEELVWTDFDTTQSPSWATISTTQSPSWGEIITQERVMASTYTSELRIEKIGTGEQSGSWGSTTNTQYDILESAISGTVNVAFASNGNDALTTANGSDDEARHMVINLTGGSTLDATRDMVVPTSAKLYIIRNGTTGGQSVRIIGASGSGITIPNGKTMFLRHDGTNVVNAFDHVATITASGDITSAGTVNVTGDTAAGDDASIGFTAAEGLILTGQGSTNDVTIKNDADADVLEIPTGTTNVTVVGDITAGGNLVSTGTVEPAGDTAAGDNAAVGFTAAEGLILTGQGSTNDVTIKNDADADVITIATGGTSVDIVGDVTASTVNADGDTSAGDNAAMGYTAAEGLILTGQGSTNDVTIKNDADADVLEIPTGTTNVTVAGSITSGTIILPATDTDTSNTGSITIDFSAHQNFVLTLTGSITLANPSTEAVGQSGVFVFIQDGTGSRTLSLGTDYESPAAGGITLSTAASAVDIVPYFVKASGSIQLGAPQLAFA